MKMDELPPMTMPAASPEIFHQLGLLTRQLHDTMNMLGVLPKLKDTVDQLPDAQSRLSYIARLTGEAAEKVLNHVEGAKSEQEAIAERGRQLSVTIAAVPGLSRAMPELQTWAQDVVALSEKSDARLTDIMMAQDFHDLTGQVVAKVVGLANELEDSLVKLLVQVVPPEQREKVDASVLHGPVVNPEGRTDVVADQKDVDDLLASLGF